MLAKNALHASAWTHESMLSPAIFICLYRDSIIAYESRQNTGLAMPVAPVHKRLHSLISHLRKVGAVWVNKAKDSSAITERRLAGFL